MEASPNKLAGFSRLVPFALASSASASSFQPANNLATFVRETLLAPASPLYNVEHDHLNSARIGFLWTNVESYRRGKQLLGTAEIVGGPATGWSKSKVMQQLEEWFGTEPLDFVITLYAPYFWDASPAAQMCVLEHELYHCGHMQDSEGYPKFKNDGAPVFGIKGHDIEEFIGVGRRYGTATPTLRAFAENLLRQPEVDPVLLERFCGACH